MRKLRNFFANRRLWLSKKCECIAIRCRSAAMYYELEHYVKRKETFMKRVYIHHRGSGKTYALIRLAAKYDAPILVPTESTRRWYEGYARDMFPKKHIRFIVINGADAVRGLRNELYLCEEGISLEMVYRVVNPCECVVGYNAVY